MNIRIDIRQTSKGYCEIDDLEGLYEFESRADDDDRFHYTSCDDELQVTVSLNDKDHIFDDVGDAINFIETLFVIETNAPD